MTAIELKITPGQIVSTDNSRLKEFWEDPTSWTIRIKEYEYLNEERSLEIFEITKTSPLNVRHDLSVGYMTKLNNQRWGANVIVNLNLSSLRAQVDLQSPIMLVTLLLEKA